MVAIIMLLLAAAPDAAPMPTVGSGQEAPQTQPSSPQAPATEGQATEDITVTGKQAARDRVVCKTAVQTGSIVAKRTCRTAGEWEAIRERSLGERARLSRERDAHDHIAASRDAK